MVWALPWRQTSCAASESSALPMTWMLWRCRALPCRWNVSSACRLVPTMRPRSSMSMMALSVLLRIRVIFSASACDSWILAERLRVSWLMVWTSVSNSSPLCHCSRLWRLPLAISIASRLRQRMGWTCRCASQMAMMSAASRAKNRAERMTRRPVWYDCSIEASEEDVRMMPMSWPFR